MSIPVLGVIETRDKGNILILATNFNERIRELTPICSYRELLANIQSKVSEGCKLISISNLTLVSGYTFYLVYEDKINAEEIDKEIDKDYLLYITHDFYDLEKKNMRGRGFNILENNLSVDTERGIYNKLFRFDVTDYFDNIYNIKNTLDNIGEYEYDDD